MHDRLYLAADSGGSKTRWVLCTENGSTVSELETLGLGAVEEGILPIESEVGKAYGFFGGSARIRGIFLSLGGANTSEVRKAIERHWGDIPIKVEREACGDAILRGAALLGASAVVMCGTGSVAVGSTKNGRAFCGGWGPVYGDGGSGGGIGTEALRLYLRHIDGLADIGRLSELFSALETGLELSDFYDRMELKKRAVAMTRRELAALAPKIYELALCGDDTCLSLYKSAAREIALMGDKVSDDGGRILLCGGFFACKPYLQDLCGRILSEINGTKTFMYNPDFSPSVTSVAAVLELCGISVDDKIFYNILKENEK